ncbi:periplasmic heavy metal sensor [Musicola paradisiaca]|uniref:Zinc resistance-associated protein n=1 Tax=Musicola paradisiaca (strain Ech703) TaxID=579405 RepID=C6C3A3_MUSP7|nr:periplasmic heavy metal sensor [Musicola paradisiaca]ACS87201.1 putative membrane-associated protein [Musicola paradisiaca Ech703]
MNFRSWPVLLVASLALNVFLLGGIAGAAWQWHAAREASTTGSTPQSHSLRFAAAPLSTERQKAFTDGLNAARRNAREAVQQGRDARRDVLRLLAAPQWDRAALDTALQRTRDADLALRTRVEQSVVDFAAGLTPDERAQFAQSLAVYSEWWQPPPSPAVNAGPKPAQ